MGEKCSASIEKSRVNLQEPTQFRFGRWGLQESFAFFVYVCSRKGYISNSSSAWNLLCIDLLVYFLHLCVLLVSIICLLPPFCRILMRFFVPFLPRLFCREWERVGMMWCVAIMTFSRIDRYVHVWFCRLFSTVEGRKGGCLIKTGMHTEVLGFLRPDVKTVHGIFSHFYIH